MSEAEYWQRQCTDAPDLRVVYRYKLANAVPLDGAASYAEIAVASGLREDLCRRFIRPAMGNRVFVEDPETQRVRYTASSRCLATDQSFADVVGLEIDDLGPASSKLIDPDSREISPGRDTSGSVTGHRSQVAGLTIPHHQT
ncbi:hypothetical protein GGR51DRAFT_564015 [Nemania sp. FL0031]|nr:hypothetical protein GGR51DRAFT_564015 [Nemania sp. FL0031]